MNRWAPVAFVFGAAMLLIGLVAASVALRVRLW